MHLTMLKRHFNRGGVFGKEVKRWGMEVGGALGEGGGLWGAGGGSGGRGRVSVESAKRDPTTWGVEGGGYR